MIRRAWDVSRKQNSVHEDLAQNRYVKCDQGAQRPLRQIQIFNGGIDAAFNFQLGHPNFRKDIALDGCQVPRKCNRLTKQIRKELGLLFGLNRRHTNLSQLLDVVKCVE